MKLAFTITLPTWLLWLITLLLGSGGFVAAFAAMDRNTLRPFIIAAFFLFCLALVFFGIRVFRFEARLRAFFRRLLANDYSTGMRDCVWISDSFTALTELANRTADRIRVYDQLRAERTGMSYRAMDMLFRNNSQALMLADMEKKQFRLNPAALNMYNVKQERYTFESIEKQEVNTRFFRMFLIAVLRDTVTRDATARLKLPQRDTVHEIDFRLEPLKDRSEKVRFAIIYVNDSRCGDSIANTQQKRNDMSAREAYVQKMQAQLDQWVAELDKLKAKADAQKADSKLEIERNSRELETKINEIRQQISELAGAGEDAWESMKQGVESAWGSLKKGFSDAASKFD